MKILLVMPTPFETGRLGLENVVWLSEPVALTSIAATVCDEHEVRILDLRLEPEDALVNSLREFQPDVVGTTSMTTDVYQAKAVLRTTRQVRPETLTIVGGHAPTLQPAEFDEPWVDVIVQGEGEMTFSELVKRWATQRATNSRAFEDIAGLRYLDTDGVRQSNQKRDQTVRLDDLPAPNRELIRQYDGRYFFTVASPIASIFTSRGCSFDCNFCAIWEFYERRTRYLSAPRIADQIESCKEDFVFILDDNFLTSKKRLLALCEELEQRKIKKYWMTQGRTDFVADNPELIARLAKNGMIGLLSGFESNDDESLKSLRKKNTWDKNIRANQILRENGVFSTGIFMVRADWEKHQFDQLYDYINSLEIGIPLVTILTPLPGTQLYKAYRNQLLTNDYRLFDLLHSVLPTRLPRAEFYKQFARAIDATSHSAHKAMKNVARRRPGFIRRFGLNMLWFYARTWRYQRVHRDYRSFLRDEEGLMNGPGSKRGITWEDVKYPSGAPEAEQENGSHLVSLRVPKRTWADELEQENGASVTAAHNSAAQRVARVGAGPD